MKHVAIYISGEENTNELAALVMQGKCFDFANGLEQKDGALFSTASIRQYVQEELLHDHFELATANGHSLASSSSGEQRKALLQCILSKRPAYIIADNVFESIDKAGQQSIAAEFAAIAQHTQVIQLLYRKTDCLSFIDIVLTVKNKQLIKEQLRNEFMQEELKQPIFTGAIPAALNGYAVEQNSLVKMNKVSVAFDGRPVLKSICWEIKSGEFWQLMGPNGSGKSTLLSMIIGDSVKGYGQELYLFGKKKGSGETVWDIKQKIGYFTAAVTQEFPRQDSIERMIIAGFVDSIGLYMEPTDLQVTLAGQWLSLLGLYDRRKEAFRLFTLAQQRMILIARAMVKHPPLLILDEPTAGLDDEHALLFAALVNKIAAETDTAIIYVSHRTENGLLPDKIFELTGSEDGSVGSIRDSFF